MDPLQTRIHFQSEYCFSETMVGNPNILGLAAVHQSNEVIKNRREMLWKAITQRSE